VTECTKKRFSEENEEARFVGPLDKIVTLRETADSLGLRETSEAVTIVEAFPGYGENPLGMALRGARSREGLTQRQLAEMTGVPQRHISEMETENGGSERGGPEGWLKSCGFRTTGSSYSRPGGRPGTDVGLSTW
jgi:DNA-binding XRE family transcriptional regulator